MWNNRSIAAGFALVALVMPLCVDWTQAQKTIKNNFQQTVSGSRPQSVYGGYNQQPSIEQQSGDSLAAPVQQQRPTQQNYFSSQKTQSSSYQPKRPQQPSYQPQQQQQQQQESSASESNYNNEQAEADAEPASYGAVNGQPGKDFPAYTRVPKTSFSCDGLPYDYGMYADEETGCQAYHVCYNGRKDSFLCGVGTVFNQRILHCDYWYSVECGKSSQYYSSNAYMGSSQPEPGPAQANQAPVQRPQQSSSSSSYQRVATNQQSSGNNRPANVPSRTPAASSGSASYERNTQQQVQEDSY